MKKYLGLLVALLLCAVLLSGCSDGATKGEYFTYIVETDGTATITGYIGNERAVVIPKKLMVIRSAKLVLEPSMKILLSKQ